MRKLKIRLSKGETVRLKNSHTANGLPDLHLELTSIQVCESSATWSLLADGEPVYAKFGQEVPLRFPGSWIALSAPITLHVGNDNYRPEFIVCVPDGMVREGAPS